MTGSKVKERAWWITRNLIMLLFGLCIVAFVGMEVARTVMQKGQFSVGGVIVGLVVILLSIGVWLTGVILVWIAAKDIVRVLFGKETEIKD